MHSYTPVNKLIIVIAALALFNTACKTRMADASTNTLMQNKQPEGIPGRSSSVDMIPGSIIIPCR